MFSNPELKRGRKPKHDEQRSSQQRTVAIAFILLLALLGTAVLAAAARGQQSSDMARAELTHFSHRVCPIWTRANERSASHVAAFNLAYYNSGELTPELLHTAGENAIWLYRFYANENARIRKLRAPVRLRAKWHRYNSQERQVLKYGMRASAGLLHEDQATFNHWEAKNVAWQEKRNATFGSMNIEC